MRTLQETGSISWEKPGGNDRGNWEDNLKVLSSPNPAAEASKAAGNGWREYTTPTGSKYYHKESTNTTQWTRPADMDEAPWQMGPVVDPQPFPPSRAMDLIYSRPDLVFEEHPRRLHSQMVLVTPPPTIDASIDRIVDRIATTQIQSPTPILLKDVESALKELRREQEQIMAQQQQVFEQHLEQMQSRLEYIIATTMTQIRPVPTEIPVEVIKIVKEEVPIEVVRYVDRHVEVPIEKVTIKEVPVPVEVTNNIIVDRPVITEVFVDRVVQHEVPVAYDKVVIREVPVPYEVERVVEKIVEKEVPVYVERVVIKEVPVTVEKIIWREIEVPVEKIVQVPVHEVKVVEVIKEVPIKEVQIQQVEVIKYIEKEVPVYVDKVVTKEVVVYVDRVVEVYVDRPSKS